MLKATIDAEIFREAIEAISAFVPECRLHTAEDGISTRAVDTANVAMIAFTLKKEAFDTFKATKSELGVDIQKMKNIFNMGGKGDLISLELADNAQKMAVSVHGYHYSITLLDTNTIRKDPNSPTINLPGKVVISGEDLNNAIKAAAVISDKIAMGIHPKEQTFYMVAEGDTDHIQREFSKDESNPFPRSRHARFSPLIISEIWEKSWQKLPKWKSVLASIIQSGSLLTLRAATGMWRTRLHPGLRLTEWHLCLPARNFPISLF